MDHPAGHYRHWKISSLQQYRGIANQNNFVSLMQTESGPLPPQKHSSGLVGITSGHEIDVAGSKTEWSVVASIIIPLSLRSSGLISPRAGMPDDTAGRL